MIMAVTSLLSSVGYLVLGREYHMFLEAGAPGPGLFPSTIGVFWLGVSLWALVEAWREGPPLGLSVEWPDKAGWQRIAVVLASSVLFILFLDKLGDLVVSFLTVLVVMRTMGTKNPVQLLGVSIALAVTSHVVFVNALGVPMPQGIWADMWGM